MNRRQVVIDAIRHKTRFPCPYNIDLTTDMREKMKNHLVASNDNDVGEKMGNFFAQLNAGSVTGPSEGVIEEIYLKRIQGSLYRDDWGVIWRKEPGDDIGVVVDPPLKEPTLEGFKAPEPASRAKYLDAFCRNNPERFRLVSLSSPVFQRGWFLRGFDNFLMDLALNEEFVHELLDVVMEYTLKVVKEITRHPVDGVFLLDDWGQQQGLLMSPEMWRMYIKPRMKTVCDAIKGSGKFVFLHSCGNTACLVPELIELGVDVLNPIQPEVMDVYKLKKLYGERISFYGGISTQQLLPYGSLAEVEKDVREKMNILGGNGGYILAPAHAVQADVPMENLLKLIEVMQSQY